MWPSLPNLLERVAVAGARGPCYVRTLGMYVKTRRLTLGVGRRSDGGSPRRSGQTILAVSLADARSPFRAAWLLRVPVACMGLPSPAAKRPASRDGWGYVSMGK